MVPRFDPVDFINKIGERLVFEFEHASAAGTPGLIGAARENPARKQLEKLLPASVSAGSGVLVDSYGARSTQQDIVFFERDFCPVYSINDTPEATYFPVEGVVATGEVKSVVDKLTLFDALGKVRSAKALRRFSEKRSSYDGVPAAAHYRPFGSATAFAAVPSDEYDQDRKPLDQVYGFLICKAFKHSHDTVLAHLCEFAQQHGTEHLPNIIVSLHDGFVGHVAASGMALQRSPLTADGFARPTAR